jgi:hypothetical protein
MQTMHSLCSSCRPISIHHIHGLTSREENRDRKRGGGAGGLLRDKYAQRQEQIQMHSEIMCCSRVVLEQHMNIHLRDFEGSRIPPSATKPLVSLEADREAAPLLKSVNGFPHWKLPNVPLLLVITTMGVAHLLPCLNAEGVGVHRPTQVVQFGLADHNELAPDRVHRDCTQAPCFPHGFL